MHFDGRICRRSAGVPNTKLIVTSRSAASAGKLVTELLALNTDQNIQAATLDQFSPTFEHDLKQLDPDLTAMVRLTSYSNRWISCTGCTVCRGRRDAHERPSPASLPWYPGPESISPVITAYLHPIASFERW